MDSVKISVYKKILLPYRRINMQDNRTIKYARYYLDNSGFNNYVYCSSLYNYDPKKWQLVCYDLNIYSHCDRHLFDTREEVMLALDDFLIKGGFKLLNDDSEVDRYRILL